MPVATVIAWIEAAHPADPARYQRDTTVAFSATGGKTTCPTDSKHTGGMVSCLVELTSPPPRPDTAYGEWKGGWVNFDGIHLQVGAARADPGPFRAGAGAELADPDSLAWPPATAAAAPIGAAWCVRTTRTNRRPGSAPPACGRMGAYGRCHRLMASASRSTAAEAGRSAPVTR